MLDVLYNLGLLLFNNTNKFTLNNCQNLELYGILNVILMSNSLILA